MAEHMDNQKPNIRIYVACHKPSWVPENPLLVPVMAGAALPETRSRFEKPEETAGTERMPSILRDDTGDNISEKNHTYCELTPQYWAWKNEEADYYGFYHYRRYLSYKEIYPVNPDGTKRGSAYMCPFTELDDIREDLTKYGHTEERMREIIPEYDIITVLRERINTSVYRQYTQFHPKEILDDVLKILNRLYPAYADAAKKYLASKDIYYMNMYVMKRDKFREYMRWLFDILDTYEEDCAEMEDESAEKPRIMGFVAERLFGIYYTYQLMHGARCAEVPYLRFYNTEPDGTLPENVPGAQADNKNYQDNHNSPIREFTLKPTNFKVKINMRQLSKLCPAGSRRRVFLRSLLYR